MTHLELIDQHLHNTHVEFLYRDKWLSGVLLDIIPYDKKEHDTDYIFIPSIRLLEWQKAQAENNQIEMNSLGRQVDITEIKYCTRLS